jgi:hypothetical protein
MTEETANTTYYLAYRVSRSQGNDVSSDAYGTMAAVRFVPLGRREREREREREMRERERERESSCGWRDELQERRIIYVGDELSTDVPPLSPV